MAFILDEWQRSIRRWYRKSRKNYKAWYQKRTAWYRKWRQKKLLRGSRRSRGGPLKALSRWQHEKTRPVRHWYRTQASRYRRLLRARAARPFVAQPEADKSRSRRQIFRTLTKNYKNASKTLRTWSQSNTRRVTRTVSNHRVVVAVLTWNRTQKLTLRSQFRSAYKNYRIIRRNIKKQALVRSQQLTSKATWRDQYVVRKQALQAWVLAFRLQIPKLFARIRLQAANLSAQLGPVLVAAATVFLSVGAFASGSWLQVRYPTDAYLLMDATEASLLKSKQQSVANQPRTEALKTKTTVDGPLPPDKSTSTALPFSPPLNGDIRTIGPPTIVSSQRTNAQGNSTDATSTPTPISNPASSQTGSGTSPNVASIQNQISPIPGITSPDTGHKITIQKLSEFFPHEIGSRWKMIAQSQSSVDITEHTVVKTENGPNGVLIMISTETNGQRTGDYTYRLESARLALIELNQGKKIKFEPPIEIIHLPIRSGDAVKWSGKAYIAAGPNSKIISVPGTASTRLDGPDTLETDEGKLESYRLDLTLNLNPNGPPAHSVSWFSPYVGIVGVRIGTDSINKTYILSHFTPALSSGSLNGVKRP